MAKPKSPEAIIRAIVHPKPRRQRVKSEADVWYEQMKADWDQKGTEHLASAQAKITSTGNPMSLYYRIVNADTGYTIKDGLGSMQEALDYADRYQLKKQGMHFQILAPRQLWQKDRRSARYQGR